MKKSTVSFAFDPYVAAEYGLEESILIWHFQYWIQVNMEKGSNFYDGKTWSYQTQEDIAAHFPFLNRDQVKRIVKSLIKQNVIVSGNYNKKKMDRTTWYAFENEEMFTNGRKCPMHCEGTPNALGENAQAIPDTKTKSKQHIKEDNVFKTMSSSTKKNEKKDFSKTLTNEESSVFHEVMRYKPQWGDLVKSNDVCAWIKKFGQEKVLESLTVYRQDCDDAVRRGDTVRSMGGRIRSILNKNRSPRNQDFVANKTFAERKSKEHNFLKMTKTYIKCRANELREEIEFNLPHCAFLEQLESCIRKAAFYA